MFYIGALFYAPQFTQTPYDRVNAGNLRNIRERAAGVATDSFIDKRVPRLADLKLSGAHASGHCLPESCPIWENRKQCLACPEALFSGGKQWHTDAPVAV
jgi:hypothetical protein